MQIYMKPTPMERTNLIRGIRDAMRRLFLNQTDLADLSGVDASQVSRILAGRFVTFGGAVVQICNSLGVDPEVVSRIDASAFIGPPPEPSSWIRVERAARRLWDETPTGADRLVRVLDAIGAAGVGGRSAEGGGRSGVRSAR